MKLKSAIAITFCLLTATSALAEQPVRDDLQATVQKLEKAIAEFRGLAFKNPVTARVIARPAKEGKSIQGYYSLAQKTLFIYDDIAGNYERGTLIHEMVHALQDQHFGLAKLHQDTF